MDKSGYYGGYKPSSEYDWEERRSYQSRPWRSNPSEMDRDYSRMDKGYASGYKEDWRHDEYQPRYSAWSSDRQETRPMGAQSSFGRSRSGRYVDSQGEARPRFTNPPKTLIFDGKEGRDGGNTWAAFCTKFHKFVKSHNFTGEECKDYLCWCLEGTASEYYALLQEQAPNLQFYDIMSRFEKRFGFRELPETAAIRFNSTKQLQEEKLEDWADRIMTLAGKAFRGLSEDYMYSQAVLRFCLGCADREAGEMVANARPRSMDEAIDRIRWAMHTHSAVYGRHRGERKEVRQVSADVADEFGSCVVKQEPHSVCAVKQDKDKPCALESRVVSLENGMKEMSATVNKMADELRKLVRLSRRRSPSPGRDRDPLVRCFRCKKEGHMVKDCPEPPPEGPKPKHVSFLGTDDTYEDDLNSDGLGEQA